MRYLIAVAFLALLVAPAFADPVLTASDTATVTLDIEKYCAVNIEPAGITITVPAGSGGGSGIANWSAQANFDADVMADLTGLSASWTWTIDLDGTVPGNQTEVECEETSVAGTLTLTVAGVIPTDGNGLKNAGTLKLTVGES
jgi:hypothetical protein